MKDEEVVDKVLDAVMDTMQENIPLSIMNDAQKAPGIMYNVIMNLLCRFAKALNLDKEKVKAHIDHYFNEHEGIEPN